MGKLENRLTNPMELVNHKSVWVESWKRPCATSFLMSMQFRTLKLFFDRGIYEYQPKEQKKFKPFDSQLITLNHQ